ncbi:MAG: ATP-binding protein [Oscillospiraceae bacterium]|nr:ATP-binding protein [Oscillospiraceae bacterium]
MDIEPAFVISVLYVSYITWTRGIAESAMSIALAKNAQRLYASETRYAVLAVSVLAALLLDAAFKKVTPAEWLRTLLRGANQRGYVCACQFAAIACLTLMDYGLYCAGNSRFAIAALSSFLLGFIAVGCLLIADSLRIKSLAEYQLQVQLLREQLARHYQSYSRFADSDRALRHDYKDVMLSVKNLLRNNESEKAVQLIDSLCDAARKSILPYKQYSNHIILDAVLQNTANAAIEYNIEFSATVHIPLNIELTDLNIVRVFSNLLNNAVDACRKVSEPNRRIEVSSGGNQNWVFAEISNSYNEALTICDGLPETTKTGGNVTGLGLKTVKEIIKNSGGILSIVADCEKGIFTARILIPKKPG